VREGRPGGGQEAQDASCGATARSFRTRGQYLAATVRGTNGSSRTRAGTLTQVKKGVVSVFDQVKKKTIVLRAGKKYRHLGASCG
jgi:hypothetical protein